MRSLTFIILAVIVLLGVGCQTHTQRPPNPKYISTVYGTTGDVPYEVAVANLNVSADLHNSAGSWISIIGGAHSSDGQAALWIPDGNKALTIIVKDQKPWSGAPSHRSLISITGFLNIEKGKMFLNSTRWAWIDS